VIFRCTAHFYRAFDALSAPQQRLTLRALAGFATSPRVPITSAKIVSSDVDSGDIWGAEIGGILHLTYSFLYDQHPKHHVCVLRNVAKK
jgi:hypothetical protein